MSYYRLKVLMLNDKKRVNSLGNIRSCHFLFSFLILHDIKSFAANYIGSPPPALCLSGLTLHLQMQCKGSKYFWYHQINFVKFCKIISYFWFLPFLPLFQPFLGLWSFMPAKSDFQAYKVPLSSLQTFGFLSPPPGHVLYDWNCKVLSQ